MMSSVLASGASVTSELCRHTQEPDNDNIALAITPDSKLDRLASSFSIFWLDGRLAGHIEINGDFTSRELSQRDGPVFDFWSQKIGYIESNTFRST